ncbi:MAG: hypothetical protein ACHP7I_00715 [Terriglobales bacterium]
MQRSRSMREVLEALDWVRREMMHHGSPDFIRQRELEGRVHQLAARLARSESGAPVASTLGDQLQVAGEKQK